MSDTTITLRGRVGTDLKVAKTQTGQVTTRFRLAVTNWFASAEGVLTQGRTTWYTIRAWDKLAENAFHSIAKGDPIIVVGRPTASAWIAETGEPRSELVITAQTVGHDLANGRTVFSKTPRPVFAAPASEPANSPASVPPIDEDGARASDSGADEAGGGIGELDAELAELGADAVGEETAVESDTEDRSDEDFDSDDSSSTGARTGRVFAY